MSGLAAGILMLAAAAPAAANQVPGATYTGTAATGGTVSFDVSAQGGSITRFTWRDVPTGCGTLSGGRHRLPIIDHSFTSFRQPFTPSVAGTFPAGQQATGTLSPGAGKFGPGCAPVGWTASTTTVAPPAPASDEVPPTIEIRTGGRLRSGGGLRVWIAAPEEPCHVTVGGTVAIAGGSAAPLRLRRVEAQLAHGANLPYATSAIEPRLGWRGLEAVRQALKNGRRVEARIVVTAVDAAGNRTVERLTVQLRH
ncbi:MAG: hypothetical protein ACRDLY_16905 [Thermoleophilaceae bacterium]